MQCPNCGHVRVAEDAAPAGQCPACGIIYAKFDPAAATRRAELASKAAGRTARVKKVASSDLPKQPLVARFRSLPKSAQMATYAAGGLTSVGLVLLLLGPDAFGIVLLLAFLSTPLIILVAMKDRRQAAMDAHDAARLASSPLMHCMTCGTDFRKPVKGALRGSDGIEIALWLLAFWAFVPVVYSIWRRSGAKTFRPECPACGSREVVPESTPGAQAHKRQLGA